MLEKSPNIKHLNNKVTDECPHQMGMKLFSITRYE